MTEPAEFIREGRCRTRDGRKVRVLATDLKHERFTVAYIHVLDDGTESQPVCVSAEGSYLNDVSNPHQFDLVEIPPPPAEPRELWVAPTLTGVFVLRPDNNGPWRPPSGYLRYVHEEVMREAIERREPEQSPPASEEGRAVPPAQPERLGDAGGSPAPSPERAEWRCFVPRDGIGPRWKIRGRERFFQYPGRDWVEGTCTAKELISQGWIETDEHGSPLEGKEARRES